MIEHPLHHAYLATGKPTKGIPQLVEVLKEIHQDTDRSLLIDKEVTETLKIDVARELSSRGRQKSSGEARCIIRGFDQITKPAQNALLKIIEEPAEGVHFFLVTAYPDHLLETIHSRVERIEVGGQESSEENITKLVEEFVAAEGVADRLAVVDEISERPQLRRFVHDLAKHSFARKHPRFGNVVEKVVDFSKDSGASVKQLKQFLAISASRSSTSE